MDLTSHFYISSLIYKLINFALMPYQLISLFLCMDLGRVEWVSGVCQGFEVMASTETERQRESVCGGGGVFLNKK